MGNNTHIFKKSILGSSENTYVFNVVNVFTDILCSSNSCYFFFNFLSASCTDTLFSFYPCGLIAEIFGGITELITINPIRLFSTIELGVGDSPASGQLYTTGIAGQKNWNGSFFGGVLPRHRSIFGEIFYPGIIGFTGFSISGGIVSIAHPTILGLP